MRGANELKRDLAKQLTRQYFESWVTADNERFIKTLHDKAVVRECNGTVIEGMEQLKAWFSEWNEHGNSVEYWDIKVFGWDEEADTAFVEWTFKCVYDNQEYEWDGSSIIYFRDSLIYEINEYEMKKEKFYPFRR